MGKLLRRILTSEIGLKIQEKCFPNNYSDPENTALITKAMHRFRNCKNKKNKSKIKREIEICKKFWKCYPYHYFTNNLYQEDNDTTEEELINYIPQFYWFNIFLPYYSSSRYNIIGENKIIMGQVFTALQISQPKTAYIFLEGKIYSSSMERITCNEIQQELREIDSEKIFVKPAEGWGGKGIDIFHKSCQGTFVSQNCELFNQNYLDSLGKNQNYIVQFGVTQSEEISKIYPDSVNTFRVITENKNGVSRVVCGMLRMGRNHKEIDNISSGGICVNIDIDTGDLGNYARSYDEEKITHHPDTHYLFRDTKISQWKKIRNFATVSSSKLPFLTYLGWDIALTREGPVALEINRTPGLDIQEMLCGGLREAFSIDDPDYYWKNLGKFAEMPR